MLSLVRVRGMRRQSWQTSDNDLTNEAAPEGDEELEDQFGGRAAGIEAGVLLEEACGRVAEAGVGAVEAGLKSGLVLQTTDSH